MSSSRRGAAPRPRLAARVAPAPAVQGRRAVVRCKPRALGAFARRLLVAAGVPAAHARLVAHSLVTANLRGVDSHGIQLIGS